MMHPVSSSSLSYLSPELLLTAVASFFTPGLGVAPTLLSLSRRSRTRSRLSPLPGSLILRDNSGRDTGLTDLPRDADTSLLHVESRVVSNVGEDTSDGAMFVR